VATVLGAAASYAAVHVRYADTEPFTGRTHLAVLSHAQARERDEAEFARYKEYNGELILSPGHGDSLRARRVALLLVRAAHHGLAIRQRHAAVPRQRITDRGLQWMDGLRWEVIVITCQRPNAMIFPGAGKIVVSSALLESFSADEEIAATLAHEVTYLLASLCYSR
jgi:Zn-dependent protease with chaperone function